MYAFNNEPITPAARNHMEAQLSFFNDLSKSMFRSVQQFVDLNIQLAQTLLEESTRTGHAILTAQRQSDIVTAASTRAQPAAETVRAYTQHLSRLAADTQVDLAKVAESHVSQTSRTARELADEVARMTNEETEKNMRKQQDMMREFSDPFARFADGAGHEMRSGASNSLQEAGQSGVNMQGAATSASTSSSKQTGSARKDN